ncbi:ethanolamine ammonia-lyase reactivating factor EutA [Clostridium formicaceticum]|uniref:Ethanolamine ammonia-lyase n=1 Tax=Clostridium formicaceticum TaxID=1497 RepID=A0AAC9WFS2_9CLOT|nr:ethanolamine ammonia-lyase reactivating factor EutA [Clostridium formicaceticum]AOY75787.1 ethanolamine ammonia-lyase [Clostridium formicaceticum]ARE86115.1 reactivating factor for ethanolamine ammonia lyase [Clostridium formicaceticum]
MRENIFSVGIDIGTSTTQLVFSKLTIENTASMTAIPKIQIIDKEIIYRSDIHFTPLLSETRIDGDAVRKIIEMEYKKANISFEKIDTGAVIITGETARKENANEILNTLSGLAGDFVVATAGPDLESIIAGKGAGAGKFSKEKACTVVNLDIGGGTTNIAIFKNGEVVDTACLDIGGRLIKFEDDQLKVNYVSSKIKTLAKDIGIDVQVGKRLSVDEVEGICRRMADILAESIGVIPATPLLQEMLTGTSLKWEKEIDFISFSGGVADCIFNKGSIPLFRYGDIGILLGKAIAASPWLETSKVIQASETIGATVVGAGTHTTEISGSTITIEASILPMKNIPILRLSREDEGLDHHQLSRRIAEKLDWFRLENDHQLVALAMKGIKNPGFQEIQALAKAIIEGMDNKLGEKEPLIIIVENDMAKILGQGIQAHLPQKRDVLCIDSIKVDNGDYIDIGKPLANGKVVPVIIKTLVLNY